MAKYKGAMPKLPERGYFKKGDKGEEVKKLQKALNWANSGTIVAALKVDGEVGNLTIAQISFFEEIHHKTIDGETIYRELRERSILVRHFSLEKIRDYNRITVGSIEQMQALIDALKEIVGG